MIEHLDKITLKNLWERNPVIMPSHINYVDYKNYLYILSEKSEYLKKALDSDSNKPDLEDYIKQKEVRGFLNLIQRLNKIHTEVFIPIDTSECKKDNVGSLLKCFNLENFDKVTYTYRDSFQVTTIKELVFEVINLYLSTPGYLQYQIFKDNQLNSLLDQI